MSAIVGLLIAAYLAVMATLTVFLIEAIQDRELINALMLAAALLACLAVPFALWYSE